MPSTSPGSAPTLPTPFVQVLPGAPTSSLQSLTSFVFRQKRYIAYISGRQLSLLSSPTALVQALTFNEDLVAVAAESQTGKIAVAGKSDVWVLEPVTEGWTKVWWEKTLFAVREDAGDEAQWLGWGNEGEMLVGGSRQLSLFSTLPSSRTSSPAASPVDGEVSEERRALWSKEVASPVQYAVFSPSASLIATCGRYDRLVKIWRRLSFEEGLFDYTYLPHPGAVTHLEWRLLDSHSDERRGSGVSGRHDEESEVLYTIATDGVLRIWRTGGMQDLDILVLHTTLDLVSAIPHSPSLKIKASFQSPSTPRPARYAFTLPSDQFCDSVTAAIGLQTVKLSHSLEHLKEIASKAPDVIISLDGHGRMSAWGLQNIGHKRRPDTPSGTAKLAVHIAHTEGVPLRIENGVNGIFEAWFEDSKFNILVHSFQGYIQWWRGDVETFFSPSVAGSERIQEVACWSGHQNGPINALRGSPNCVDLASYSADGELAQWKRPNGLVLRNTAAHTLVERVLDLGLVSSGDGSANHVLVLKASNSDPCQIAVGLQNSTGNDIDIAFLDLEPCDDSESMRLFPLTSRYAESYGVKRFVVANRDCKGWVLTIDLSNPTKPDLTDQKNFCVPATQQNDIVQQLAVVSDDVDLDKAGIICIRKSGLLSLYYLHRTVNDDQLEATLDATFESGVSNASLFALNNDFAAIASSDGKELTVVDLKGGYVEHRHARQARIRHIVPNSMHNVVAVGYDTTVDILAQGRYEHHREMPPWILIKQMSVAGVGLTIDALAWLGDGSLAVAAGNGIFLSSNDLSVEDLNEEVRETIDAGLKSGERKELSSLARQLIQPLPVWHPSLLSHSFRHGHWPLASSLLERLLQKLKFWSEGDALHPFLDVPAEQLYGAEDIHDELPLDEDTVAGLLQQLEEKDLPEISRSEQQRLKEIVQATAYCSEHVKGLDNGALRFLFIWKLELLNTNKRPQPNGVQPNGIKHDQRTAVPEMHWREIAFAYHSTTQQPLLDILLAHYDNKITWEIARRLGLFAWLADREALNQIFEALAQSAYRSSSPPDPIDASLYFLALHKKPTLIALWRIATWHREQRATVNFLRRDFIQPENKRAAKKNAYALMGKKRFDYAAAFFLLADDAASATSLLASQCEDIMLSIAVARLYSGDGSAVLRRLVGDRLIPEARRRGDRWQMSWCHSILFEKDEAAYALVRPLEGVRSWQLDDPDTLTLYRRLRKTESQHEYEAILRAARILRRMGLWLLALELVSQWEFNPVQTTIAVRQKPTINGVHEEAQSEVLDGAAAPKTPSMLDGFVSSDTTPILDEKAAREAKAAEMLKNTKAKKEESSVMNEKRPKPTQFKEPEAYSLLDDFGF